MNQFRFAFNQLAEELNKLNPDWEWVNMPLLIAWNLQVNKRIILSEKNQNFQFIDNLQAPAAKLENLVNTLKTPLESFQVYNSFIPGLDFSNKKLHQNIVSSHLPNSPDLPRPFYLLPKPIPLSKNDIQHYQFLDRVSHDWWRDKDPLDSYRDCYLCQLRDQQIVFAYRNYRGDWQQYGI